MRRPPRWVLLLLGLTFLAVGLGTFNYTKPSAREFHTRWAEEHGLPAPGRGLFSVGIAATALGVVGVGAGLLLKDR